MNSRMRRIAAAFEQAFGGRPDIWVRAPGRVDLMGSHTDYNLGYVLTLPISRDTVIAARRRQDGIVRMRSLTINQEDHFALDRIQPAVIGNWANYVRGVASVLREQAFELTGFDGMVDTNVPIRSGLSSSAALECAVAVLFRALDDLPLDAVRMAQLCQRAENEFAGVSCGILDQYTSCAGREGCALLLDCRDLSSRDIEIAPGLSIVICDTRSKRELAGSEYGTRRAQCEEGARIMGVASLRDCTLDLLESFARNLAEQTWRRCRFIVEENARVLALAGALPAGQCQRIADVCAESFQGATELYQIVTPPMTTMMKAMMAAPGVVGARQAGAGFGGCMVAFVETGSVEEFARAVSFHYLSQTGIEAQIYPVEAAPGASIIDAVSLEVEA